MAELPKSVVERLKAQPGPQEHPDPNLLAAFSEQALKGRERESVLAHLAVCADCRQAVALALPETTQQQPSLTLVPWYRRPQTFAWSAIAATLVVGAALVVNYNQQLSAPPYRSASAKRAEPVAEAERRNEVPQRLDERQAKPAAPAAQRGEKSAAVRVKNAPTVDGKLAAKQLEQKRADGLAVTAESAGAPGLRDKVGSKDEAVTRAERDQASDRLAAPAVMAQAAQAPPPSAPGGAPAKEQAAAAGAEAVAVESSKPAPTANAVGGMLARRRAPAKAKGGSLPAKRWSISSAGRIQQSLDDGRSWEAVQVAQDTIFRALAAVGDDIWAGGAEAALYHSSDGGGTWKRQTLPGSSATIVSLSFRDSLHGAARTADGVAFSTADGGQHWTKD